MLQSSNRHKALRIRSLSLVSLVLVLCLWSVKVSPFNSLIFRGKGQPPPEASFVLQLVNSSTFVRLPRIRPPWLGHIGDLFRPCIGSVGALFWLFCSYIVKIYLLPALMLAFFPLFAFNRPPLTIVILSQAGL